MIDLMVDMSRLNLDELFACNRLKPSSMNLRLASTGIYYFFAGRFLDDDNWYTMWAPDSIHTHDETGKVFSLDSTAHAKWLSLIHI